MSKVMYVTVGTSLFHSATWEADRGPAKDLPYYDEWLLSGEPGKAGPKQSPEARLDSPHAPRIRAALRGALSASKTAEWAACLPDLSGTVPIEPMRFGAELTTILKMSELGGSTPRELLATYARIHVVFDGNPADPSATAGAHLVAYLNRIAGAEIARCLTVAGLSSSDPLRLLGSADEAGALKKLVKDLVAGVRERQERPESVDLVITGGYKIYGVVLAPLADLTPRERDRYRLPEFRLVYLHERGNGLVTYSGGLLALGEDRLAVASFYESGVLES